MSRAHTQSLALTLLLMGLFFPQVTLAESQYVGAMDYSGAGMRVAPTDVAILRLCISLEPQSDGGETTIHSLLCNSSFV